jgi:hypothetical protein
MITGPFKVASNFPLISSNNQIKWAQKHRDHTHHMRFKSSNPIRGKGGLPLDMDFNFGSDIVHVKLKYVELSDVQQNSSGLPSSSSGWKTSARFPPNLQTKCQNHNQLIHVLWICWNWSDIWLGWIMCIKSWHKQSDQCWEHGLHCRNLLLQRWVCNTNPA